LTAFRTTRCSQKFSRGIGCNEEEKSVKVAEFETLIAQRTRSVRTTLTVSFMPEPASQGVGSTVDAPIERVVLVHRLREVVAQVGFTRFESAAPDTKASWISGQAASLAPEVSWLPAFGIEGKESSSVQQRGIRSWMNKPDVNARAMALGSGLKLGARSHSGTTRNLSLNSDA